MLINKPNQTEDNQNKMTRYMDNLLNPYNIQPEQAETDSSWDALRAKRGR